jgi:branched-chain amino acid transport system ATP-binding protein
VLLEVADLSVAYAGRIAVHGVTVQVEPGQIVALVGPNGAGKSSVVRAVCGLVRARSGSVVVAGREVTRWSSERRARAGVGLVPEGRRVFASLTVTENLLIPLEALRRSDRDARMADAFGLFPDLEVAAEKKAGHLSGGQQQMLAVARALMLSPTVLLLDEPTMGLAPLVVDEVLRVTRRIADEGAAVVVADESARRVVPIADRVIALRAGRAIYSGGRDDIDLAANIERAYFH